VIVWRLILMAALLQVSALASAVLQEDPGVDRFTTCDRLATEAYRAGDHVTAEALWREALSAAGTQEVGDLERGRLLYNLGNALYRQGNLLVAVAWYTAALRLTPRDPDLWANLELARSEVDLEPADRGDLAATLNRLLESLTLPEAEWSAALALALLALALGGEALRGGLLWRRLATGALVVTLLASAPLLRHLAIEGTRPLLVVQEGGTQGRSEPRSDSAPLARLEAGQRVQRLDALPGWVRVEGAGDRPLWVREASVFDLAR